MVIKTYPTIHALMVISLGHLIYGKMARLASQLSFRRVRAIAWAIAHQVSATYTNIGFKLVRLFLCAARLHFVLSHVTHTHRWRDG